MQVLPTLIKFSGDRLISICHRARCDSLFDKLACYEEIFFFKNNILVRAEDNFGRRASRKNNFFLLITFRCFDKKEV